MKRFFGGQFPGWRIGGGVLALALGGLLFLDAHSHRPGLEAHQVEGSLEEVSRSAYHGLHVAGWALVILGVLMVLHGAVGWGLRLRLRAAH